MLGLMEGTDLSKAEERAVSESKACCLKDAQVEPQTCSLDVLCCILCAHMLTWLRRYFPFWQLQFENLRNEASAAIMPHWMWKACQHGSVVFVSHLFRQAGGFEWLPFFG